MNFEAIWEAEGEWSSGRLVLSTIVNHLRGRGLKVVQIHSNEMSVGIPLPLVEHPDSSICVGIQALIPANKLLLFGQRCDLIVAKRPQAQEVLAPFRGAQMTDHMLEYADVALAAYERKVVFAGSDPLWKVAARVFGLRVLDLNGPSLIIVGDKASEHLTDPAALANGAISATSVP
jgi:hypothetical protein